MKAVILMFDTLCRNKLPNYNPAVCNMPNFERLGRHTTTFNNFYVGSMPCMPARRDLHTGRLNFLHRSWGPLEPFDDSVFAMLKKHGIYSHLITDHQHYWEDGGATYHNRYSSYEFVRGQEGDLWKARLGDKSAEGLENYQRVEPLRKNMIAHDRVNRQYHRDEKDYPQAQCYQLGLEFLSENYQQDNWLLQIECFDPHEPFTVPDRFKAMVDPSLITSQYDWPDYCAIEPGSSDKKLSDEQKNYQALLLMCDEYLGKVLDFFDAHNLWQDTLLIVNTDHGFMFGEKNWSGKSVMPVYNEIAHVPFFIWHPHYPCAGQTRNALAQMHDVTATLLDYFNVAPTETMTGHSLSGIIADDTSNADEIIFGYFGAHVTVTDGRYLYMRANACYDNKPLYEYTLMPMRMRRMFNKDELVNMEIEHHLPFSKGMPVLKVPGQAGFYSAWAHGNLLFDLQSDPEQLQPLTDYALEARMMTLLHTCLKNAEAPEDEWRRLGLPPDGAGINEENVRLEHQQRQATLTALIGELCQVRMHPETLTLLLDIVAAGGQKLLQDIASDIRTDVLCREDILRVYAKHHYPVDLSPLFERHW
ncbi:sulfatase [Enterobacter sp.]|uniref:sulfatase n=1 Tax=Enterobacter sp. TaxID=42895 RepID=UPI00296EE8BE|nr:sulfatase [Enterobacter sp.]